MMKVSPKGVLEIAEHEGIVIGPYLDSVGVWTYGVGHTAAAGGPDPAKMTKVDTRSWSREKVNEEVLKALRLFDVDLDKYEARVNKAISRPLTQHQFDALVSFDFNTGGIHRANLTKDINAGRMDGNGFMGWVRRKEIIKRRKAEQALFRNGNYDANGSNIPVYDTTINGKPRFRFSLNSKEVEGMMRNVNASHTVPKSVMSLPKTSIYNIFLGWAKNLFKRP